MKETAVSLGAERSMLGILTRPTTAPKRTGVVLMNAGLVHRVGPNRLNVNLARRLAGRGYTTLRLDLSGIGDSAPRRERCTLEEAGHADLKEALEFLGKGHGLDRFVLIGVCSGADLSLTMAARNPLVSGAVMIDSFAYATALYQIAGYSRRVIDRESWRNLISGRSDLIQDLAERLRRRSGKGNAPAEEEMIAVPDWVMPPKAAILEETRTALSRGAALLFVYSGGPALYNYLTNFSLDFLRLRKRGAIEIKTFLEADHTFTMSLHQEELLAALERWLVQTMPD